MAITITYTCPRGHITTVLETMAPNFCRVCEDIKCAQSDGYMQSADALMELLAALVTIKAIADGGNADACKLISKAATAALRK